MKKPEHLRAVLETALARHDLAQNPDRLFMVAVDWRPIADMRPGDAFQVAYTLVITLLDFAGDPVEITIPLMRWLKRWQHDILAASDKGGKGVVGTFELLDHGKYDVELKIQLTERVHYADRPGGGQDIVYIEEPVPFAYEEGEPLHALFLNGEPLFHCTAHPDQGL